MQEPLISSLRLLWLASDSPEPWFTPAPVIIETPLQALTRLSEQSYDALIISSNQLPRPSLQPLRQMAAIGPMMQLVVRLETAVDPLELAGWTREIRNLRLVPPDFSRDGWEELLERLAQWKRETELSSGSAMQSELERIRKLAMVDLLTGLLRREELMQRGESEVLRAHRTGQNLVCIMGDIDHFKRVNDIFGHATGDHTLQRVARLINEGRRPYDLAGRMGGEEFMMLCPSATLDEGRRIAERTRLRIEEYNWRHESLPPVTLSFGVSELQTGVFNDLAGLSLAADEALYEAKRRGRNQVRLMRQPSAREPMAPILSDHDTRLRLLLIDDSQTDLELLAALLERRYQVKATTNPAEALAWAEMTPFDLVISDQNMPEMKGHQLLAQMKMLQPNCVRFIMSGHGELASAIQAINQGEVYRYITKPPNPEELLLAVHQAFEHRAMVNRLRSSNRETIMALAATVELKARRTRGHYRRVAELALEIAGCLGYNPERLERLEFAAWLHDIGKIGVPDHVLDKRTHLTASEERLMREHPQMGANLVGSVDHLAHLVPFIRYHHERFDGLGYPDGLSQRAIPEEARILTIADYYDSLTHPREPGHAESPESARMRVTIEAGHMFDPVLVGIFERVMSGPRAAAEGTESEAERSPGKDLCQLPDQVAGGSTGPTGLAGLPAPQGPAPCPTSDQLLA